MEKIKDVLICKNCFYFNKDEESKCSKVEQSIWIRDRVSEDRTCSLWRCKNCLRNFEESIVKYVSGDRLFIDHTICEKITMSIEIF